MGLAYVPHVRPLNSRDPKPLALSRQSYGSPVLGAYDII